MPSQAACKSSSANNALPPPSSGGAIRQPILKAIGTRKLRELSAGDVRQALVKMAIEYCSAAVTMGHLALKRSIRHAEANDLVSRNVATLVDTPKGQGEAGRPSPLPCSRR